MIYLLLFIISFILGVLSTPFIIFIRAKKCDQWDNSNMFNIWRIVAHLATHPDDFGKMQYENGNKPFWYINKDEFSDIVNSRPKTNHIVIDSETEKNIKEVLKRSS